MADDDSSRLKLVLMDRLRQMMRSRRVTQVDAGKWFGVSQCRISHLVNNRVHRFTSDALVAMLAHAGVSVSVTFLDSGDCSEVESRLSAIARHRPSSVVRSGPPQGDRSLSSHERCTRAAAFKPHPVPPAAGDPSAPGHVAASTRRGA
jgi:predicted XRE-type DNA-binding protein